MLASEIANENLALPTVHTTLKRMLKKGLVKVVGYAKSGNVFGRCYQTSMNMAEYEMHKFSETFPREEKKTAIVSIVESILDGENDNISEQELDELELIIKKHREKRDKKSL